WARQGFPFVPAFFDTVQDYFGAEAREMDFGDPATRDVINQWVSDATNGRIDTIVESISPLDILFLINAVYFKGDWTTKFDRDRTAPAPFQSATGSGSIQVETMNARDMLAGLFHLGATGIEGGELPYGNQAFTLTVVMPPHGGSVEDVVAALDDQAWKSWMEQISYDSVHVALPKMEIEYETRLDSVLMTLGMGVAFDANRSDFSNLTPAQDAHISRVRHKTFLKVDEEGTEAAAATSVDIGLTSLPQGLYVDRPFILAIRERLSGTILFLGVIRDPRG
ncbi:MAG: serpin family protein, partial [Gemmatimonadota bacterium]|nr:serpin family protein [Gemmatimonadota bacterium]